MSVLREGLEYCVGAKAWSSSSSNEGENKVLNNFAGEVIYLGH